jgi:transposase
MEQGTSVSVINPLSIKRYAQMKLARAKTDKYDAALIAGFGASQEPEPWTLPKTHHILEMQQLRALEEDLMVQKGMLMNQKEAFSQNPFASKIALKSIEGLVGRLQREMKEHYAREAEILCSIPGLGSRPPRP